MLYIHIPFCDSKCFYCAFHSYTDRWHLMNDYMQALLKQFCFEIQRFDLKPQTLSSVFIGGGTPSCVPVSLYAPLFELISPYLAPDAEITTEANPNSATRAWIAGMQQLGVNRISFGVQSFDDAKLKFLGRAHNAQQALIAIEEAADLGIKHLSLDLIYGCHIDTKEQLSKDLSQAFQLPIDHLSCYALTLEKGTPFAKKTELLGDDETHGKIISEMTQKHGFEHYEISNFGTYRCRHNIGYWELKNYIGLGSGAVGFLSDQRFSPIKSPEKYIADPLTFTYEKLSSDDLITEKVLLGLRSCVGFEPSILTKTQQQKLQFLIDEHKVQTREGRIYNPDYFIADEIALYLL